MVICVMPSIGLMTVIPLFCKKNSLKLYSL